MRQFRKHMYCSFFYLISMKKQRVLKMRFVTFFADSKNTFMKIHVFVKNTDTKLSLFEGCQTLTVFTNNFYFINEHKKIK